MKKYENNQKEYEHYDSKDYEKSKLNTHFIEILRGEADEIYR